MYQPKESIPVHRKGVKCVGKKTSKLVYGASD